MFRFFRKHSWILIVVIALTIISFVFFFSPSQRMNNGGGRASSDFGSVYGKKITQEDYVNAGHEFDLFYFFHYGEWPDKLSADEVEREIYVRLLLIQKADDLGIYIGDS